MKINKSYRTSLIFTILIMIAFIIGSFVVSVLIARSAVNFPRPSQFIGKILMLIDPNDPANALMRLESMGLEEFPLKITILDESGRPIYPPSEEVIAGWESLDLPKAPFDLLPYTNSSTGGSFFSTFPKVNSIVLLPLQPKRYVLIRDAQNGITPPTFILISLAILLGSVFLGVGFALFYIFGVIRQKLVAVDDFMSRLKAGDLKARIEIKKMDEVGATMSRFNQMADEIELLVENLRKTEKSRVALLQELAHDLRTPIASLKSLLESLESPEGKRLQSTSAEIVDLCLSEVNYFQRLVEDLLFLGQMSEPMYKINAENIDLNAIIESAIDEVRRRQDRVKVSISHERVRLDGRMVGDSHLIKRLVKNALSNAISFADRRIEIRMSEANGFLDIEIGDDGPGFNANDLAHFGERRISRVFTKGAEANGKVSVGLGSVIMKSVVDLHRGTITPSNKVDTCGTVRGAKVLIQIPLAIKN
jgi:signal transduction histidine kinase